MVWLSDRQRRIVMELSRADSAITGDSLSRMLGCSKRTIQSDISRINIASGRRIVNSTNRGYELDSSIDEVLVEGFAPAGEEPPFSGHALVRELLLSDSAPTASDLAVRFYSSQSSVARALKRVRSLLEPYDLRLEKTDGRLYVTGTPENRKRFLRDMVCV
ncbi:HTH domain-containing protein [Olsenella uli]|uniref:HTH domain-containing protein n=1 Tax=Olsenella uli TaxID=133926 RepID=UPI00241F8B65|nr:HTH domain-containing protein [Olsenella uli]